MGTGIENQFLIPYSPIIRKIKKFLLSLTVLFISENEKVIF